MNRRHDVAVIQAALAAARAPRNSSYWTSPIDGDYTRHRVPLEQAIGVFQQMNGLAPSCQVRRGAPMMSRLETALPVSHRDMTGVAGTALVKRDRPGVVQSIDQSIQATEKAVLPDQERQALVALQRRLGRDNKLCFILEPVTVAAGGRLQVTLACPNSG